MHQRPLVSIITVSFNSIKYIQQTFDSVLNQTYANIEYIIVDGKSTDGTVELIEQYAPKFEQNGINCIWRSEPDNGIYDAMNKGILMASGDLISIINSDDWLENDAIEQFANAYENTDGSSIIVGNTNRVDEQGKYMFTFKNSRTKFLKGIHYTMSVSHPSVCVPSKLYKETIGLFDTSFEIIADYDFIYRSFTSKKVGFTFFGKSVANMRVGGVSDRFDVATIYLRAKERYFVRRGKGQKKIVNLFLCVKFFVVEFTRQFLARYFPGSLMALRTAKNGYKRLLKNNPLLFSLVKKTYLKINAIKYTVSKGSLLPQKTKINAPYSEIKSAHKHIFFGYYDKSPWNPSCSKLAYHEVDNTKRLGNLPAANICIFDIVTGQVQNIGSTLSWNWQQGSMLQWLSDNTVIYNTHNQDGEIVAIEYNIETGQSKQHQLPIYYISSNNQTYLSLNFFRLLLANTGYGYPQIRTKYGLVDLVDATDGVWLGHLSDSSGQKRLLFSIDDVKSFLPKANFTSALHHINHLSFCPESDNLIFIHRWQNSKTEYSYHSRLLLYDQGKREFRLLLDNDFVSHFCWINAEQLLIYATDNAYNTCYMRLNIQDGCTTKYLPNALPIDGHPSYDHNRHFLLTDTYPNKGRIQNLIIVPQTNHRPIIVGEFYSPIKFIDFERCDLHPRWSPDASMVCVDTSYTGRRSLCLINVEKIR